jgi:hypothetical protein
MRAASLFVVVLLVVVLGGLAVANEPPPPADRTKKTAPWNAALVEPGYSWWCSAATCERARFACEIGGNTCAEQRRAWGYSYYLWFPDYLSDLDGPGAWDVGLHSTREKCAEARRASLKGEDDEGRDYSNISPCMAVGDVPLAKLPRGKGWWCTRARSMSLDFETSVCTRVRAECVAGTAQLGSTEITSAIGNLKVIHACRRATSAWAADISVPKPRFAIFETEADCLAVSIGAICHKVK